MRAHVDGCTHTPAPAAPGYRNGARSFIPLGFTSPVTKGMLLGPRTTLNPDSMRRGLERAGARSPTSQAPTCSRSPAGSRVKSCARPLSERLSQLLSHPRHGQSPTPPHPPLNGVPGQNPTGGVASTAVGQMSLGSCPHEAWSWPKHLLCLGLRPPPSLPLLSLLPQQCCSEPGLEVQTGQESLAQPQSGSE